MIYLDNAATTKPSSEVVEAMLPYLNEYYGNPSASYSFAAKARSIVNKARIEAANLIGAEPDEIYFTSGGTESDNTALKTAIPGSAIITDSYEHPAVLNTAESLKNSKMYDVRFLKPDNEGFISIKDVENEAKTVRGRNSILSVMTANNEIGTINDIEHIGAIAHENNVIFHTDAVQAFGHIPIDVKKMNIDMLSASAHKLHGPKGIGILFVRRGLKIDPFISGGGQENGLRSGTENVAAIAGFQKACELAYKSMAEDIEYVSGLRDILISRVLNEIEGTVLTGTQKKARRLPGSASFAFKGIEGSSLIIQLDMKNICASTGSACSAASKKASHVLRAINLPDEYINGSLRFGISKYNTSEEINRTVDILKACISNLRSIAVY